MAKLTTFFLVVLLSQSTWAVPSPSKIAPSLQTLLADSSALVEIIISFSGGTGDALSKFEGKSFTNRSSRAIAVTTSLKEHSAASQAAVRSFLDKESLSGETVVLWISNQIYVKRASPSIVHALAEFSEVSYIKENVYIPLEEPSLISSVKAPKDSGILAEWGVEHMRAPTVWASGYTGEGVIVATISTGVRGTHEALVENYAGIWYDPYYGTTTPNDQQGTGTRATGIIAGGGGIGVAPGARWGACRGCDVSTCGVAQLLGCALWSMCPDMTDCEIVPHLISNVFGTPDGDLLFHHAIAAWQVVGQIPLFPTPASGPNCSTMGTSAELTPGALAISSITSSNELLPSNSKGPTLDGTIKPDICAPGYSIRSASNTSDTSYSTSTFGAWSSCNAAGAVALLLSKNPNLTYTQVKNLLQENANIDLVPTGQNCGGIDDSEYPNHSFGYGTVDIAAAFIAMLRQYPN